MNASDRTFIPLTDVHKNLLVQHGEISSVDDANHIEVVEGAPDLMYLVLVYGDIILDDVGVSGGVVNHACYDHPIEAFVDY